MSGPTGAERTPDILVRGIVKTRGRERIATMDFPLWGALLSIGGGVVLMLGVVACCVVRCFRPESTRGAEWLPNKDGKEQLVKGVGGSGSWLRQVDGAAIPAIPMVQS